MKEKVLAFKFEIMELDMKAFESLIKGMAKAAKFMLTKIFMKEIEKMIINMELAFICIIME